METVYLYGTKEIGKAVEADNQSILALGAILKPHNLTTIDFSWPETGEIEILLGGDYAKYGTSKPLRELLAIAWPEILHFESSPVYEKTIVTGILQGKKSPIHPHRSR